MIIPRIKTFTNSLPEDWDEKDEEWANKLKKSSDREKKRNKLSLPIAGGISGASTGALAAGLIQKVNKSVPGKPILKGKASYLVPASVVLGTTGLGVYSGIKMSKTKKGKEYISRTRDSGRLGRYKKMDKEHRAWIREHDSDPSKFIDWKYIKQGGYIPYKNKDKK